jgi:formylglycine-generating enzyme required for sulfatase activity
VRACRLALAALALAACHDLSAIPGARDAAADAPTETALEAGPETLTCGAGFFRQGDKCVAEPASCRNLPATCGPDKNDNCCNYGVIAGGAFSRGYDASGALTQDGRSVYGLQASMDTAPADITSFALDRYEVTVGRFRKFLDAAYNSTWLIDNPNVDQGTTVVPGTSGEPKGAGWRPGWRGRADLYAQSRAELEAAIDPSVAVDAGSPSPCQANVLARLKDTSGQSDNKPMTCVTWHEALLFCIWDQAGTQKAWLPTEAQWNFAATDGERQRAFPWSMPPGATSITSGDGGNANHGRSDSVDNLDDVGSHGTGASAFGQLDLAGNAREWVYGFCASCRCYVDPVPYSASTPCPEIARSTNPIEFDADGSFSTYPNVVARGGSYKSAANELRTAYRSQATIGRRYNDTGWRCARAASSSP